jgi:hypothetical protein
VTECGDLSKSVWENVRVSDSANLEIAHESQAIWKLPNEGYSIPRLTDPRHKPSRTATPADLSARSARMLAACPAVPREACSPSR